MDIDSFCVGTGPISDSPREEKEMQDERSHATRKSKRRVLTRSCPTYNLRYLLIFFFFGSDSILKQFRGSFTKSKAILVRTD